MNKTYTITQIVFALFIMGMCMLNVYKLTKVVTNIDTVKNTDFVSYYTSGEMVRDGDWKQLYTLEIQEKYYKENTQKDHFFPYRALPPISILFAPLSLVGLHAAYLSYVVLSFAIICFVVYKLGHTMWGPLTLAFSPLVFSLVHGQTAVIVLLGMCMMMVALKNNKPWQAGLWYSLVFFKFQFLVGLPFVLIAIKEKSKFLAGLAVPTTTFLASLFFVDGGIQSFVKMLTDTETFNLGSNPKILISGQYFLQNAIEINKLNSVVVTALIYLLLWIITYINRHSLNQKEIYTIAILASLLFGYHIHIHDQILLLIPALLLINEKKYKLGIISLFIILTVFYSYSPLFATPIMTLAILYILNYKYLSEKDRRDNKEQNQNVRLS